jgi:hypothetical protein
MKKTILRISLLLVGLQMCFAQNTLYFVSGEVYDFDERIWEYKKRPVLFEYNIEAQRIDTLLLLNESSQFMNLKAICLYNTFGYLIVIQSLYEDDVYSKLLTIIDLSIMQKKSIKIEKGITNESNLLFVSYDSIYYCVELMENGQDRGFNKDMEYKNFKPKDYNYVYIQGGVGTPIEDSEYLLLYNEEANDNALHISKGYGLKIGPYLELQPPKEMYNAYPPTLKSIRVNDFHSMIIAYDASEPCEDKIGEKYTLVYDKVSKKWYDYTFKGNASSIRSYDNGWVTGTVKDMNKGQYFDTRTRSSAEYDFKRVIPGYEEREPIFYERADGIWGDCFDERVQTFGTYYPGLLYLFNVHTKDYIEWDTKQGDSEVLLVQDDNVYYRVNTKILKSAIIDNKKLGAPELLIDDVRVRDIHWAYLKKVTNKQ